MQYIILDLEFNQPFDFPTGRKSILEPNCPFEIIQIGAVKLNESLEITGHVNFLVKPQLYTRIHPYVEKMTSLNMKILDQERTFPDLYSDFVEFVGNEKNIFGVWGTGDISALFRNILYYNLNSKLLTKKYINVQALTTSFLKMPGDRSIGLKNAVETLGIEALLPFHDALNDAFYTAAIFRIVNNPNINVETYNISLLKQKSLANGIKVNRSRLFTFSEKELGKKLSDKEKEFVLKIYSAGQSNVFKQ